MANKIKYSIMVIGLCLSSLVSIAQSNSNTKKELTETDTTVIIQKSDSLANLILKTYDENSMRETGVPLAIEHYDKIFSFNDDQKNIFISYHFNRIKFYGPTGNALEIKGIDKFPFRFDIIYDSKTKMVYQGKLVENKYYIFCK